MNPWSPSNDPTRIPEVRHNLRLIGDACKNDLDGLAREAKALQVRKTWIINEDARLRKKVEDEAERKSLKLQSSSLVLMSYFPAVISRLQQVQLVTNEIASKSKELSSIYEASLEPFSPLFYKLVDQFSREFDIYRLDEIVVAAIAPLVCPQVLLQTNQHLIYLMLLQVRRMVADWHPLEDPLVLVTTFRNWRRALRLGSHEEGPPQAQVDVYGSKTIAPVAIVVYVIFPVILTRSNY